MDATRKKEARTTKDNMAKDSNGRDMGLSWGEAQTVAKTGPCGGTLLL